jgi:hypothetical protein
LARDAYRWLRKMAQDENAILDEKRWAEWSRIEDRLDTMEPTLRYLEQVETELRRRRFSAAGVLDFMRGQLPARFRH